MSVWYNPHDQFDWDEYLFEPQPDITAYEIAMILKLVRLMGGHPGQEIVPFARIYMPADGTRPPEWPLIERHYRRKS